MADNGKNRNVIRDFLFAESARESLHIIHQNIFHNWKGLVLLILSIISIFVCLIGAYKAYDVPYINFALCFTIWPLIIFVLFSFDEKRRSAIIASFSVVIYIFIYELMIPSVKDTGVKIAESEHQTIFLVLEQKLPLSNEYEMNKDELKQIIDAVLMYRSDEVQNGKIYDRVGVLIKKGDEIYYEKKISEDIMVSSPEIIEIKSYSAIQQKLQERNVTVLFQYAKESSVFKNWLISGFFYTFGISKIQEDFITSGLYRKSFNVVFYFLLLCFLLLRIGVGTFEIMNQRDKLEAQKKELERNKHELEDKNNQIEAQNEELAAQQDELELRHEELKAQNEELQDNKRQLEERNLKIEEQREELEAQNEELRENKQLLEERNKQIELQNEELAAQQDELEARNVDLQEKNDKLHRFELVYNRMMSDVKKTAKYDPIQGVQVMQFSWRDFIDTQIRSGRHSLRNNVTGRAVTKEELKVFEDEMYTTVINPTVENIISQLNKTVEMIDTEPLKEMTQKIYDEICEHIKDKFSKSNAERDHISVHTKYIIDGAYVCDVNLHRLKAIVENLCFNTRQAFFKKRDELEGAGDDEAFDNYDVSVGLFFSIEKRLDGEYLCIDYRDNATGFPDDLLPKIYHSPVPSDKGGNRKGEGTMYISFFVENMNGSIEAENQIDENGRKCAVTKIFIPTKEKTKEA